MDNKISFTAYLNDEYSKKFDKLADASDAAVKDIVKDLDTLAKTGTKAARSIDSIEKRMQALTKVKKMTIDTNAIKHANEEIKALQREKDKLDGTSTVSVRTQNSGGFGLNTGFAVATGAAAAIGAGIYNIGQQSIAATAKYQKFEAVLANMFGNQAQARDVMDKLTDFAAKTPYQIDELTDSFVKLKGQGFEPTLRDMTSMGDLAASKGKSFEQLTEAILDAQTNEYERLKEFGIKAKTEGDKVTFMFNEKKTTVENTSSAIRDYILSLGNAKGVTGAMEAISKTTGGQLSNLDDSFDQLYKTIGDRFKPEIDASITSISNLVGTIKGWMAIPIEQKINEEVVKIGMLQSELTDANTSEERRKKILEELEKINPKITEGINKESIEYGKLAENIDKVVDGLQKKIMLEKLGKENSNLLEDYADYQLKKEKKIADIRAKIYDVAPDISSNTSMTLEQKMVAAKQRLDQLDKDWYAANPDKRGRVKSPYSDKAQWLGGDMGTLGNINNKISELNPEYQAFLQKRDALAGEIDKAIGVKKTDDTKKNTASTKTTGSSGSTKTGSSSSQSSMPSISGGQKVTHLNININNLVGGGVNVYSSTIKEGAGKIKDNVVEALMTAVNDANLIAN